MTSWKIYKLGNICDYVTSRTTRIENYISTENMLPNRGGVCAPSNVPSGTAIEYKVGDILISNIRPYFQKIWQADCNGACSADVLCIRANNKADSKYLYYLLSQQLFFDYVMSGAKGCKMPRGDKKQIMQWQISLPSLEEQRRIAGILSAIDDKIENNRRINDNLEQQAQALFDEWFVNDIAQTTEYNKVSLTDIANYLNGLAMQRFRPKDDEKGIPVLKIKELGQGSCDLTSDLCSPSIDKKYIIEDGDIIFSWSGTLLVDVWCGGTCGLNQHLFKVTSEKYPKWFVYHWTKFHLAKFIRIAKDKAVTMGHIKRGDLETSEVLIPNAEILSKMDNIIAPIFDAIISRRVENKTLATLRDTLLPKLMSGEIKVSE